MPSPSRSVRGAGTRVAVLCALESEQDAFLTAFGQLPADESVVVPPATGISNVNSAAAAQQAIHRWQPGLLLLVGIAAGIDVALGDILVPDKIVGYESGKLTPGGLDPDPEPYRATLEPHQAAREVPAAAWAEIAVPRPDGAERQPAVHFGTVHTGEKVIADDHTALGLRAGWRKSVGIDMEAHGVAHVAHRTNTGFLMIKAVCDHADSAKGDDWQPYAAAAAASFAVALLRRLPLQAGQNQTGVRPEPTIYMGQVKLAVCDGLGPDWHRLADFFGIPQYDRAAFPQGREPHGVWEWLERRRRLTELPSGLDHIGRSDLKPTR